MLDGGSYYQVRCSTCQELLVAYSNKERSGSPSCRTSRRAPIIPIIIIIMHEEFLFTLSFQHIEFEVCLIVIDKLYR